MRKSQICTEIHPVTQLRCWKRIHPLDLYHMTVLPNKVKDITTIPQKVTWAARY